jgi:hypothetical protein
MADKWYYSKDGAKYGPVKFVELQQLVQSGEVTASDFVWAEGMIEWQAASKINGLCGATPPDPSVSAAPPSQPPGVGLVGGLWKQFVGKAKKSISDATNSLQAMGGQLTGSSQSEPYQAQSNHLELSTVVSHPGNPDGFPWAAGTKIRLVLTPTELFFVECPMFGTPSIALRIPLSILKFAKTEWYSVENTANVVLDLFRYSVYQRRILKAVEKKPQVLGLIVSYFDETKYNKRRVFIGLDSGEAGMSLDESAFRLLEIGKANDENERRNAVAGADQTADLLQAESEHQKALLNLREEVKSRRQMAAVRLAQVNDKIAKAKAKERECGSDTSDGNHVDSEDILEKIDRLGQLREKGLITEDEFQTKKKDLLSRL